jgi:hypothetical protein
MRIASCRKPSGIGTALPRHVPQHERGMRGATFVATERIAPPPSAIVFKHRHSCHQDIIAQANIDRWLRGEMEKDELHAAPDAKFREHKVSKRMNRTGVGDDNPTIIEDEETLL